MARNTPLKPSAARIRELFSYDTETGVITRKMPGRVWSAERRYGMVGAGSISTHGYVMISIDGRNYNAGCVAWSFVNGEWPQGTIRYLNGNKTDNRIANLIVVNEEVDQIKHRPLTHVRLKELLHYEPNTGWFTWRVASPLATVGERAGGFHGYGYRTIGLDYNKFLEHHLAWLYMTGEWPEHEVDHINNARDDNRWGNLREATRTQNNHNKKRTRTGTTGHTGVYVCGRRYRASLNHSRSEISLGVFATVAEARVARLLGEIEHVGHLTSFNEERDGALPAGAGKILRLDASTSMASGKPVDGLIAYNQSGVPFWVKGVETVSRIIVAMSSGTEAPKAADPNNAQPESLEAFNGAMGFGS